MKESGVGCRGGSLDLRQRRRPRRAAAADLVAIVLGGDSIDG
jgi:hypothetical protein